MSGNKRLRLYYLISAVMLTIFPSTFLLMPLSENVPAHYARLVMILTGTAFWVSCISGYCMLVMAYRSCLQKDEEKDRKRYIFSNPPTKVADSLFLAGMILGMVLVASGQTRGYVVYIDIFVIILAFNMHLLFSGALYRKMSEKDKGNA